MLPESFAQTGYAATRISRKPPALFQVMGERSSGTNYVRLLISMNTDMTHTEEIGWKHGVTLSVAIPSNLVVVCAVRHPERWALSMFNKPWHTHPSMQRLPFSEFLRAEWRTIYDRPRYFGRLGRAYVGQPLQQDRDPATGAPFRNLFALRRAKLAHLSTFPARGCNCVFVRMEDAQKEPEKVVNTICRDFGLPERLENFKRVAKPKGWRFRTDVEDRPHAPAELSAEDRAFMWSELDHAQEAALGYRTDKTT